MDDRRYQIFVSSTYTDLVEERTAVIQAIQKMDHIPAGMELFPAANENQWDLIKQVIDQSDYYVVVVAGRYGSVTTEGVSYTEKEYDYAIESKIPVLGFVHEDPDELPGKKIEQDSEAQELLTEFRRKVKSKPVNFFTSAEGLSGKVVLSLIGEIKKSPRVGWVRGDKAMTLEQQAEVISLREQISALQRQKDEAENSLVEDTSTLAQGSDRINFKISFTFYATGEDNRRSQFSFNTESNPTWDEIFGEVGPLMIDESSVKELKARTTFLIHKFADITGYIDQVPGGKRSDLSTSRLPTNQHWEAIEIQLRALGLIASSPKKHGVQDTAKYLSLTAKGLRHVAQIRAIRRPEVSATQ